jgi:Zn-dependent peptidase ImmA (M78 family)/DNA-binding XRE family transcriptional regulator
MAFDLKLFGNKLKRSRNQLQLTTAEVTSRTGIEEKRLLKLEKGELEPSGDEVLIFADLFKQNYNYFISNQQKSASEQVDILYRKFGNDFTKDDRWAIQEFIFLCESEHFIFKNIGQRIIEFNSIPKGAYFKGHGEEAARTLRAKLHLADNDIVLDPYNTFRQLGLHIFRRKLSNSKISGLFINHPFAGKCVLINYDEDIYRQNFTLTHEVGHTIFDANDEINISFDNWSKDDLREIRANSFASNFLVPKTIFKKLNIATWTEDKIVEVAKRLQVNPAVLLISMKDAGVIKDTAFSLNHLKIPKHQKLDPELKNLSQNYFEAKLSLLQKGLSTFYVRNAFECYNREFISAGKLAEMLLCNESELVQMLKLFNLQLSYDN